MVEFELALFIPLNENQLLAAIKTFGGVLDGLGCADLEQILPHDALAWQPDGSGFGFMGEPISLRVGTTDATIPLTARPHISGFTSEALPGTEHSPWFSAALVFESEQEAYGAAGDAYTAKYLPAFGFAVLKIAEQLVKAFEAGFETIGAYFSAYSLVLQPWQSMLGEGGNLWAFDLAVVPQRLEWRFRDLPTTYARQDRDRMLCLANRLEWTVLPWSDAK